MCRESAVGSNPMYPAVGSFNNCSSVPGMMSCNIPRQRSSSTKFFIVLFRGAKIEKYGGQSTVKGPRSCAGPGSPSHLLKWTEDRCGRLEYVSDETPRTVDRGLLTMDLIC